MDTNTLAQAISDISPFNCSAGVDYVEISDPEGMKLDNVVLQDGRATWGSMNEFYSESQDPEEVAQAVVHSMKDML